MDQQTLPRRVQPHDGVVSNPPGPRRISHWDAEDVVAWEAGSKAIARRNLLWSVVLTWHAYVRGSVPPRVKSAELVVSQA